MKLQSYTITQGRDRAPAHHSTVRVDLAKATTVQSAQSARTIYMRIVFLADATALNKFTGIRRTSGCRNRHLCAVRPVVAGQDGGEDLLLAARGSWEFGALWLGKTAHRGVLWQEYKDAFAKTDDRPPLDPVREQFPEEPSARIGLRLQTRENLPVPRIGFLNKRGNEMIQVQNDRFIKNWRKEGEGEQYPRYEKTIRPHFDRHYGSVL
jgi:hypothetical protein